MNRSNWIHAGAALVIQLGLGVPALLLGWDTALWFFGGVAAGAFIGIEWMQQIYIHVRATGREWPTKLDAYDVWMGFMWDKADRYGDAGLPLLGCILAATAHGIIF